MSSSVFFKFRSSKEPSQVKFDGTGISVFDLKREIITKSGLENGSDFDLPIFDEVTGEEYQDDTTIIPRSTTVIALRRAAARPGHGKAARYLTGKAPVATKNLHRLEGTDGAGPASGGRAQADKVDASSSEAKAAFAMIGAVWDDQLAAMPEQKTGNNAGQRKKNGPSGVPADTYTCHRCYKKGHWIQLCPTNDDPNFANRPIIRRTTGIPKSLLDEVDAPPTMEEDGLTDTSKLHANVMLGANGKYVVARPDKDSWEKFQAKANASTAKQQKIEDDSTREIRERGLECPLCKGIFVSPIKTTCCSLTYCFTCIENALANNDLTCPSCSEGPIIIEELVADEEAVGKIRAYEEEKAAAEAAAKAKEKEREEAAESKEGPEKAGGEKKGSAGSKDAADLKDQSREAVTDQAGPGRGVSSTSTSSNPKKRSAEDDLDGKRAGPRAGQAQGKPPTGPAAMSQGSNPPTAPAAHMNGQMNGPMSGGYYPNMGPNGQMNAMMMMMMMNQGGWNGMSPMGGMMGSGYMGHGGHGHGGHPAGGSYNYPMQHQPNGGWAGGSWNNSNVGSGGPGNNGGPGGGMAPGGYGQQGHNQRQAGPGRGGHHNYQQQQHNNGHNGGRGGYGR